MSDIDPTESTLTAPAATATDSAGGAGAEQEKPRRRTRRAPAKKTTEAPEQPTLFAEPSADAPEQPSARPARSRRTAKTAPEPASAPDVTEEAKPASRARRTRRTTTDEAQAVLPVEAVSSAEPAAAPVSQAAGEVPAETRTRASRTRRPRSAAPSKASGEDGVAAVASDSASAASDRASVRSAEAEVAAAPASDSSSVSQDAAAAGNNGRRSTRTRASSTKKSSSEVAEAPAESNASAAVAEAPRHDDAPAAETPAASKADAAPSDAATYSDDVRPRRRGRPRKSQAQGDAETADDATASVNQADQTPSAPRDADASAASRETEAQAAEPAKDQPRDAQREGRRERGQDRQRNRDSQGERAGQRDQRDQRDREGQQREYAQGTREDGGFQRRSHRQQQFEPAGNGQFGSRRQRNQQRPGNQQQGGNRPQQLGGRRDAGAAQQRQEAGNGKRQRRNQQREVMAPKTNREELAELKVAELRTKASELGIDSLGLKKNELVDAVYNAMVKQEGFFDFVGIFDLMSEGYGFVRTKGYLPSEGDIYVPAQVIRANGLRRGDQLAGIGHAGRPGEKYAALNSISSVNGVSLEEARNRPRFGDLTPVFPTERLTMEHGKDSILGRCIDLVAPIGKGQRGLIVSPPKAGKTTVLKKIAESISANNPEVHLICLLVDERPEEVTDMQRSIRGEVVASTFDMPSDNHITVAELVIERAKRLVEMGRDVVILLDSITRLARAYNLAQPASGRILSGGVDSTALYPPKRFLGAARNIENGGSLTILASALVETGSKMDEVIFEEFKGTGNMELKLDRELADRRIFPAIDPIASGTRKEELLVDANMAPFVWGLRRLLAGMNSNERAMTQLIKGLKGTSTNDEFLIRCAKKAQMQDLNF